MKISLEKLKTRIFVILKFEAYFQRNVQSLFKKAYLLTTFRAINDVFSWYTLIM